MSKTGIFWLSFLRLWCFFGSDYPTETNTSPVFEYAGNLMTRATCFAGAIVWTERVESLRVCGFRVRDGMAEGGAQGRGRSKGNLGRFAMGVVYDLVERI